LCAELRGLGVETLAVQGDLEDEASCQSLFDTTVAITGTALQCVVNNASLFVPDEGADFDEAQALAQIKVNLMAPMRFGKWMSALHAHDTQETNGTVTSTANAATQTSASLHAKPSVIHVLDQKVFNLNPDYFSYTLSKLALERAVSLQAQSGLMYPSGPQTQDNFNRAAKANLLRQPIDPADVASSVVFLASNASITGTTVRVDNGQHLVPLARDVMFVVEELFKS
jgi:NAD(P)-dependent dehydrogenase (short-subunit alcohol dehydrogenase family)